MKNWLPSEISLNLAIVFQHPLPIAPYHIALSQNQPPAQDYVSITYLICRSIMRKDPSSSKDVVVERKPE